MKAWAEYQRGDWDGALAAAALVEEASVIRFGVAWLRAQIVAGREGPQVAMAYLDAEDARGRPDSANGRLLWRAALAAGAASIGDVARARAEIAEVRAIAAPFAHGGSEVTPRSAMGGPAADDLILAALGVGDALLLDEVEAEVLKHALTTSTQARISSVRAMLGGDGTGAARELLRVADIADRLDLAAGYAVLGTRLAAFELTRRGQLGAVWHPILQRARSFAHRAKASYWLGDIDRLAAAIQEASLPD